MASAWRQQEIERCLIQAQYRNFGFCDDEEISWLHIPREWMGFSLAEDQHTPTESAAESDGMSVLSAGTCSSVGHLQEGIAGNVGSQLAAQPLGGHRLPEGYAGVREDASAGSILADSRLEACTARSVHAPE